MSKKLSILIALILFIFVVVGGAVFLTYQDYQKNTEKFISSLPAPQDHQRNDRLDGWVFSHSERITLGIARQIVKETMKYKHGLLMLALFEVESNFIPSAISNKGARGLGQIHWPSHYGVLIKTAICQEARDLYDIETNIRATNLILTDMLKRSNNDVVKALKLYLGGYDGVYTMRILNNFVQLSLVAEAHGE